MAIKTVFGLFQGNKNKQVSLFSEYIEQLNDHQEFVKIYLIHDKNDRCFCLESGGILYRICAEYQKEGLKELIKNKEVLKKLHSSVNRVIDLLDSYSGDRVINGDANLFYALGKGDQYQKLLKFNNDYKSKQQAEREKQEQEQALQQEKERQETLQLTKSMIKEGKQVCCKRLVLLADHLGYKIPLRTRGWLLHKGLYINDKEQRFTGKSNGSQASFKVYKEIQELL